MRRIHASLSVALCVALLPAVVAAQTPSPRPATPAAQSARHFDSTSQAAVDRSSHLYEMGEQAFEQGDMDRSRRAFDDAVDAILTSGVDIRDNSDLQAYYRELIEKIHKHQMQALDGDSTGFAEQAYVPADDELAKLTDSDLAELDSSGNAILDGTYNLPFTVDQPVYQFISYFTEGRGRSTMENGLRRSGRYRKMAEKIFKEEGVPTDLIWLAQVESVWKPAALSSAAAKGIWQFIPSTGRRFGLDQDYYVDQRSDPEQSTRAAARYLKFLYNYFAGDWLLAMAAYNSGEGNVSKAIARSGYADFWEIHRAGFLPNETRNYVPAILSVIIVSHNQKRYGFNVTPEQPLTYDLAKLDSQTDLSVVADVCGVSEDTIRDLNPHLRRNLTPPGASMLRLPTGKKKDFDVAYAAMTPEQRMGRSLQVTDDSLAANGDGPTGSGFGGGNSTIAYSAKPGETLSSIASQHNVSTLELARVNKLESTSELKSGQVLQVPAASTGRARYVEQPVRKTTYRAKADKSPSKSRDKGKSKGKKVSSKDSNKKSKAKSKSEPKAKSKKRH